MTGGGVPGQDDPFLEGQLSTVLLLQAMYPLSSELVLSPDTQEYLDGRSPRTPRELSFTLTITPDDAPAFPLTLAIDLPTTQHTSSTTITARQPPFFSRRQHQALLSCIVPHDNNGADDSSEYILNAIEAVKARASELLADAAGAVVDESLDPVLVTVEGLERAWFWFPSLSTREKRKDIVDYAADYDLTGFVLAGKPGLLCLEGAASNIAAYMSTIKSTSWSDIPSYQKKVTERFRRPIAPTERKFVGMREITSEITQHGQFGNRGEMSQVRAFMDTHGVGEDFGNVVLGTGVM
ncbi:hypothetical protein P7C73_g5547, partial [Tremellales sp. Uapishka_1]